MTGGSSTTGCAGPTTTMGGAPGTSQGRRATSHASTSFCRYMNVSMLNGGLSFLGNGTPLYSQTHIILTMSSRVLTLPDS